MILLFIDLILNQGLLVPSTLILIDINYKKYYKILILGITLDIIFNTLLINTIILSIIFILSKITTKKIKNQININLINIIIYQLIIYDNIMQLYVGLLVNLILLICYKKITKSYDLLGDEISIQKN